VPTALPNIVLCVVGAALLLVGVLDKGRSDAVATALLMLGSGIVVIGALLSRLIEVHLSPEGLKFSLHPPSDKKWEPANVRAGARGQRSRRGAVITGAVITIALLLVAGAAARSVFVTNYRVPVVDPRPEPCSWTLTASPAKGVKKARVPRVVGLSPDAATTKLRVAQLTVQRSGTIVGECVVKAQSRSPGMTLTRGQTMIVRLATKPVGGDGDGDGGATVTPPPDNDADDDGFNSTASGGRDCNDNDSAINPNATEQAGDQVDQNCDGQVDPDNDLDNDGFNSTASGGTDCDDTVAAINPDATEQAGDQIDQNCDGQPEP
jgi:hypothetical protein